MPVVETSMHDTHMQGPREAAPPLIADPPLTAGRPVIAGVPSRDGRRAGPWQLPCTPAACRRARTAVRAVLAQWNLGHLTDTAELLVSELVGNALLHAAGPLEITVEHGRTLRCRVEDGSAQLPHRCAASVEDEHGRGLELVHRMSSDWGVDRTGRGKSVWFELR